MGAEDNLATVKGIYEAFGSGDMDAILAPIADTGRARGLEVRPGLVHDLG